MSLYQGLKSCLRNVLNTNKNAVIAYVGVLKTERQIRKELKKDFNQRLSENVRTIRKHQELEHNLKMGCNIYGHGYTKGEYSKLYTNFHHRLKYMFIKPILHLSVRILDKFLMDVIPPKEYNTNLIAFDNAIECGMIDWFNYYLNCPETRTTKLKLTDLITKVDNTETCKIFRTLKRLIISSVYYDTAYRELFNFISFRFVKEMNFLHKSNVEHVIYSGKIIDNINFFYVYNDLPVENQYEIVELMRGHVHKKQILDPIL